MQNFERLQTENTAGTMPSIGQPLSRTEGKLKVTGQAPYTADIPLEHLAYACLIQSEVAKGRVLAVDTRDAEAAPGVLAVLTRSNAPKLNPAPVAVSNNEQQGSAGETWLPLQDDILYFNGQHLGIIAAETLEQAFHAASLVRPQYQAEAPIADMVKAAPHAFAPEKVWQEDADKEYGDFRRGWSEGQTRIDAMFTTAVQHHVTMEPHATTAVWEGDKLTLFEPTTWVNGVRRAVAAWLSLPPENIRVVSKYVGGSFGCKGPTWPHVALAALIARRIARPVRLVLTRPQTFWSNGYRPEIRHRIRLAATPDGRLTALSHDALAQTAPFDDRAVAPVTKTSRKLYACPNVATTYRLAPWNMPGPFTMRGPGESPGLFALESAMDELAAALKIDPIELRLRNHADNDPEENKPWSSKHLKECYQQGAERFGWHRRNPAPGAMRDGSLQVGWGMASMAYDAKSAPATARAVLHADGSVLVESATCDQGTGSYTIMRQVAADALGVPVEQVRFDLGDTRLPYAPISAGSQTAASVGSAVQAACAALRKKAAELARANRDSPLHGLPENEVEATNGRLHAAADAGRGETYTALLERLHLDSLEATEEAKPGEEAQKMTRYSFGAHFAEVKVDPELGEVRVTRYVGAFAAGRILNAKTARSQLIGGVIWGIGMALHERTYVDPHFGRMMNHDLAEYHVPVNADVPEMDLFFVEEQDEHVNRLGVKGIGEIGTIGAAAAIANAVYHATGRRIRDLPITPDKLL